jgi:hypothetical protein
VDKITACKYMASQNARQLRLGYKKAGTLDENDRRPPSTLVSPKFLAHALELFQRQCQIVVLARDWLGFRVWLAVCTCRRLGCCMPLILLMRGMRALGECLELLQPRQRLWVRGRDPQQAPPRCNHWTIIEKSSRRSLGV